MSIHKRIAHAFLAMALVGSIGFSQAKVGTTAAQFLGIAIGPRALAMGGAFVAQRSDVTALYWNPGSVSQLGFTGASFSNTEWIVGTHLRWVGAVLMFDAQNAIGISVTQLDYGDEEITTVASPDGIGEYWSAADLAVGLTYSRRLTDKFSIGGTVKYVHQSIWNETASTVTFDAGLLFETGFNNMRLGMTISNFGGDLTLDGRDLLNPIDIDPDNAGTNKTLVGKRKTDAWPTPQFFRVGVAMDMLQMDDLTLTLTMDALRPNDNDMTLNVGGEITFLEIIQVRAGYKSLFLEHEAFGVETELEGLTAGAGITYQIGGLGAFDLQYAFNTFGFFGDLNTLSVGIRM